MTPEERAYVRRILDLHEETIRAARRASDASRLLVAEMNQMAREMDELNEATHASIDAMLAANREALGLYNDDEDES